MSRVLKHLLKDDQQEIGQEEFETVELELLQGGKISESPKQTVPQNPPTSPKVQLTGNNATDSITELKNSARLERVDLRVGPVAEWSPRKNSKEKIIAPPPFKHHPKNHAAKIFIVVLALVVCAVYLIRFKKKTDATALEPIALTLPTKPETNFLIEQNLNREAIKLFHAGKFEDALDKFLDIQKKYPDSSSTHTNLGMTYFKLGDAVKAKDHLLSAVFLNSKDVIAFNNLGIVSIAEGDYFTAVSYFEKAIRVSPSFPDSHLNLGKVLEQMGKPEQAIVEYQAYVALPTADPVVKRVLSKRIVKLGSISRYFGKSEKEGQD